ncbi:MAG: helix-turn-helix domain-containing protein [Bauldia sp.]
MANKTLAGWTLGEVGDADHGDCRAVTEILDRVGDKWTVMVVGALAQGPVRFNALQRSIEGVSHRMLTLTLRGLQRDGVVRRTAYPTTPPKVEYELTALGTSLIKPLYGLFQWARENRRDIERERAAFDRAAAGGGRPPAPGTRRSAARALGVRSA